MGYKLGASVGGDMGRDSMLGLGGGDGIMSRNEECLFRQSINNHKDGGEAAQ